VTDAAKLLIDSRCALGEGPFWHPLREALFWFDINAFKLHAAAADGTMIRTWSFDEHVAAAAVIDRNRLAVATETGLVQLDLQTNERQVLMPLEADQTATRTNDSRVDRTGGFWISTMLKDEGDPGGTVYRFREGKIETLIEKVAIPNSICFSPDGRIAYFTDTPTRRILQCDTVDGVPVGDWRLFADASDHRGYPDGSVTDSAGYVWNARWGGSCVVRHAPDGSIDRIVELPVSQVTCPAFGGPDYKTLFITTANKTLSPEQLAREPQAGGVFAIEVDVPGLPEPALVL
jgi:sugar lactone lactonase YvrE